MLPSIDQQTSPNQESKNLVEYEEEEDLVSSSWSDSPSHNNSRPTSMVIKKANAVIPAHLMAEAISTLRGRGLDLRWSGPITPSEMQYVQQYVFSKYPEYCNGLIDEDNNSQSVDLYSLCLNEDSSSPSTSNDKKRSPKSAAIPSYGADMLQIHLEPSKLLDVLAKKTSSNFVSIPEIQARNRALQWCGLTEEDYHVLFTPSVREAMIMVGEAYPFFRGNYYMTILGEDYDVIREFASCKDSKVVGAPEAWLDLRIKGSQLSQYFRRKCKHVPKGLFAYPGWANGDKSSMHWISEAHRNSWHVLLNACGLDLGINPMALLALHRPDFVMCTVEDFVRGQASKIVCLLVRKKSFQTTTTNTTTTTVNSNSA